MTDDFYQTLAILACFVTSVFGFGIILDYHAQKANRAQLAAEIDSWRDKELARHRELLGRNGQ